MSRIVTHYPFKRRDLLRGIGAGSLLLAPFLRSLAEAQAPSGKMRLVILPMQHGWNITNEGIPASFEQTDLPAWCREFRRLRNKVTVYDGFYGTDWGNAHDVSYTDILTSANLKDEKASSPDPIPDVRGPFPMPYGPSIDWVIANALKYETLRWSADFASWGCNYHPICWKPGSTRNQATGNFHNVALLPMTTDPTLGYGELAGLIRDASDPPPAIDPNILRDRHVADFVLEDVQLLQARLSRGEKSKLELYLDAVNEAKKNLALNTDGRTVMAAGQCTKPYPARNGSFHEKFESFLSLAQTALACDTHQIVVLGVGEGARDWAWTDAGAMKTGLQIVSRRENNRNVYVSSNIRGNTTDSPDFHHTAAHNNSHLHDATFKESSRACMEGWVEWYAKRVVDFALALDEIKEADGKSLLDRTFIVLTGEVSEGNHNTRRKPYVVIGGGAAIPNAVGKYVQVPRTGPRASSVREGEFWRGVAVKMGVPSQGLSLFGRPERGDKIYDLG